MPKRRERCAGYIRESDERLADSTTIESGANAIRKYAEKQHYIYDTAVHEYKEAISGYEVPYFQRKRLMDLLAAAERHEFDVVVITEVRALSRRGPGEVMVIYDMLQKHGVRLETITEKFADDTTGQMVLTFKAVYAKMEREQNYVRMQRGRRDRVEIGKAPNGHPIAAYGYVFLDSDREAKASYVFDHCIIHIDESGQEWTPHKVCVFIFESLKMRMSLHKLSQRLNEIGIPPPGKPRKDDTVPHWSAGTLHSLLDNPIYTGEVWINRYQSVEHKLRPRPREEWIQMPPGTAPAYIDKESLAVIREQLTCNKRDSLRNNQHQDELGLLRAGHIFCGICGRAMQMLYPVPREQEREATPRYMCRRGCWP